MTALAERVESMVVRAASPDGRLQAKISGGHDIAIGFRPGTYRDYRDGELARQLAQLLTSLYSGYEAGFRKALSDTLGRPVASDQEQWDAVRRRFHAARCEVVAYGRSPGGQVGAKSTGLRQWDFRIKDGTVGQLGEDQFLAELDSAVNAVRCDDILRVSRLRSEIYGT